MKTRMRTIKRLAAALLLACLLAGSFSVTSAEAALKKVTGLSFIGYLDSGYTQPAFKFNNVKGASAYQIKCTYTNNSNAQYYLLQQNSGYINGLEGNRIYRITVRAIKVKDNQITGYGAWSSSIYTIPVPRSITFKKAGKTNKSGVKFSWSKVLSSQGYVVQIATSASGPYRTVATTKKVGATSATVKKYNGSTFKAYKNYYYRVLARKKIGSKYKTSQLVNKNYYYNYFYFY